MSVMPTEARSADADNDNEKPPMWDFVYETALSVHGVGESSAEKYADKWSDPYGLEPERPADWLKFNTYWKKTSPSLYTCGRPKHVSKDAHGSFKRKMASAAREDYKSEDMPTVEIPWKEVKQTCLHQYPRSRWLVEPSEDDEEHDEPYWTDEEPDKDSDDVKTVLSLDDAVKQKQSGGTSHSLPEFPSYHHNLDDDVQEQVTEAWMSKVEWMMPDLFAGASIELVEADEMSNWG